MKTRQYKTAFPLPARKGIALKSDNMVKGKRFFVARR